MFNSIFKITNSFNSYPNELDKICPDYKFCDDSAMYGRFSRMNVFIGENNSGKSRFLRALFSSKYYEMTYDDLEKFYNDISDVVPEEKMASTSPIIKFNDIYHSIDHRNSYSHVTVSFWRALEVNSKSSDDSKRYYFPVLRGIKDYKTAITNKLKTFLSSVRESIQTQDSVHHFVSLLKLESSGLSAFDIYREIIEQEYFNGNTNNQILTGGMLFQEIKSHLLGDIEHRNTINEFQKFLCKHFFPESGEVQLTPNEEKGVLCVKIGDDERAIYNWGDGTQQLITMLFSIFKHKDEDAVFFIEEPELYLHPGLLRKFIEVINLDMFNKAQYFITTHSNIVLDTSADANINMSIFKFKKLKDKTNNRHETFTVEQCNNGDVSLLNELGVRNSSVFLSNCSIWVEGITDRLYLKHYLKLYTDRYPEKKQFRESLDYTFIEYGGGNLVHFNFDPKDSLDTINAKYINNKIFLIADNDNSLPDSKKGERKAHLKEILKDNFYELPVVEVENLITPETLKNVLKNQNDGQKELIDEKITEETDFRNVGLGEFIGNIFGEQWKSKCTEKSGTIKNKLSFCSNVIQVTTDYDRLSQEAKELTEKIYNFIEQNNKD